MSPERVFIETVLLNAYVEFQAQRDMWMGRESPSIADGYKLRMDEAAKAIELNAKDNR